MNIKDNFDVIVSIGVICYNSYDDSSIARNGIRLTIGI